MKKKYIIPWMKVLTFRYNEVLISSGNGVYGSINSHNAIQYGGVDEDGELDPD